MAKYDALRDYLRQNGGDRVTLTFAQIDQIVPGGLPESAYKYQAWWENEVEPRHVQCQAWKAAGYDVERVDLSAKTVTFRKRPHHV